MAERSGMVDGMEQAASPVVDGRARDERAAWLALPALTAHARRPIRAYGRLLRLAARLIPAALLVVALLAVLFAALWQALPATNTLESWVVRQTTVHHAAYVPIGEVSPVMVQALVAAEDERFFQHHGIDTVALLRAAWDDLRAGRLVEGGSTLTAQLAKNAYLGGNDHTIPLKVQDLVLALKIEHAYSKSDILEMYLNLVYYGEGAYGIHAAAARYFGTTPARLDLAQAALLAGLVQAPGTFDPWCHPRFARAKQHAVLARMVAVGYVTPAQSAAAAGEQFSFWQPGIARPFDAYCPE